MNTTAYNQFAKEIANYINYHCDGVDEGFEIEYEGFTAFVSYKAEIREDAGDYWTAPSWTIEKESTTVAAVWDEQGNEYPASAVKLTKGTGAASTTAPTRNKEERTTKNQYRQ